MDEAYARQLVGIKIDDLEKFFLENFAKSEEKKKNRNYIENEWSCPPECSHLTLTDKENLINDKPVVPPYCPNHGRKWVSHEPNGPRTSTVYFLQEDIKIFSEYKQKKPDKIKYFINYEDFKFWVANITHNFLNDECDRIFIGDYPIKFYNSCDHGYDKKLLFIVFLDDNVIEANDSTFNEIKKFSESINNIIPNHPYKTAFQAFTCA
jgi:hypothetical protein